MSYVVGGHFTRTIAVLSLKIANKMVILCMNNNLDSSSILNASRTANMKILYCALFCFVLHSVSRHEFNQKIAIFDDVSFGAPNLCCCTERIKLYNRGTTDIL